MEKRGNREEMVIATKFTTGYRTHQAGKQQQSNFTGNHSKSLHNSLNASLKKLKTDYVDVLYVHWWDYTTSIPELMQSLNAMVLAGKVLYLGVSDTPAWVVSKANECMLDLSSFANSSTKLDLRRPQQRSPPIRRLPRSLERR